MNKAVLVLWCISVFFSVLCAACDPAQSHIWTSVVIPLMCLGIVGFNKRN